MNSRQEQLFLHIVEEYTQTAQPVGSRLLVEKFKMDVSPATVRNDMADLEKDGLIIQPHTSAGRIVTQEGFQHYIDNYLTEKKISVKEKSLLDRLNKEKDHEMKVKNVAKLVAEISGATVVVGFNQNNVFYTGISNLLSNPEFANLNVIYNLSSIVDKMDVIMANIFDKINETEINLGPQNYFSPGCATILTKYNGTLFGILGPVRMDYARNLGLVNYVKQLIN